MKVHVMELPHWSNTLHNTIRIPLLLKLTLILLTIVPLYLWMTSSSSPSSSDDDVDDLMNIGSARKCDMFTGKWVPYHEGTYYTNMTCQEIHDQQNCMKFGRPDTDFLKWRWKPDDCELPLFNPVQFLNLVRGKSMAFVGDSVGRNQMQSLMCLLSMVVYPVEDSYTPDGRFKSWLYADYSFTIASFWSPHLVKAKEANPNGDLYTGLMNVYLDEPDEIWTTQMDKFDYVIISAGQWFFRPLMFYEHGQVVGCHSCLETNITDLTMYYGYREAFRTAFRSLNDLKNLKAMTFLRTFSPAHFENGIWNEGGNCERTKPFMSNEMKLEGFNLKFYLTQVEEFRAAKREGRKRGFKFRLLDTTQAMVLRPDGHPGHYGQPHENVTVSDCVHWCLPGPIDTWNELLLQMLNMEGERSFDRRV